MKSSIIDVPRKHTQEDLFGIQVYQDALIEYIRLQTRRLLYVPTGLRR